MNRPRKKDRHLPACVYLKHGAYYHVRRGKWTRLGTTLAEALRHYSVLFEAPKGSMPDLISNALTDILTGVKPNTASQYRGAATKLAKAFAEFGPMDVKPKHVAAYKASLIATPNMANRCLSVLRMVFDWALERELVESNPVVGVKRLPEAKRKRLLAEAEYAAIRAAAAPRLQVIMDLLLLTGQRVGDVLAIRRADLTEEGIRFEQQKTGARLIVKWTPQLREAVDRAKGLNRNIVALTLLHNRRGKAPDYRSVKEQWDRACKRAKVEDAHLHDLRALAATSAKREGKDATALLGHTTAAQTVRYLRDREAPVVEGPSIGRKGETKAS